MYTMLTSNTEYSKQTFCLICFLKISLSLKFIPFAETRDMHWKQRENYTHFGIENC